MLKPSYEVCEFGLTKYGETARKFTLRGAGGVVLEVSDYGGKVVRLFTPDREGVKKDVVVGFDSPAGWDNGDPYWGCIIGRYGNRIAAGKFRLNGVEYTIPTNNAPAGIACGLHGGTRGWDAYVWGAEPFVTDEDVGVIFTRISPDGENGFPGEVKVKVTYTLTKENVWRVEYEAVPNKDTPINMTQHVYFNFKGEAGGSIEDHVMTIAASRMTPADEGQIPTGEIACVEGTPFDFRKGMRIGEKINAADRQLEIGKGYDHNWILDDAAGKVPRFAAKVAYPGNGREVEVWTTEPCIQVYTANWASYDQTAKGGEHLSFRCGVALETQHAPDSPNKPQFPTTIVKAGEVYHSMTEFRFAAH